MDGALTGSDSASRPRRWVAKILRMVWCLSLFGVTPRQMELLQQHMINKLSIVGQHPLLQRLIKVVLTVLQCMSGNVSGCIKNTFTNTLGGLYDGAVHYMSFVGDAVSFMEHSLGGLGSMRGHRTPVRGPTPTRWMDVGVIMSGSGDWTIGDIMQSVMYSTGRRHRPVWAALTLRLSNDETATINLLDNQTSAMLFRRGRIGGRCHPRATHLPRGAGPVHQRRSAPVSGVHIVRPATRAARRALRSTAQSDHITKQALQVRVNRMFELKQTSKGRTAYDLFIVLLHACTGDGGGHRCISDVNNLSLLRQYYDLVCTLANLFACCMIAILRRIPLCDQLFDVGQCCKEKILEDLLSAQNLDSTIRADIKKQKDKPTGLRWVGSTQAVAPG